jgi:hypothetical protein
MKAANSTRVNIKDFNGVNFGVWLRWLEIPLVVWYPSAHTSTRSKAMANVRSPNYPNLSLPAAIERIRKIHSVEGKNAIARESIVKLIGFNGLHGASAKVLSAIGKYGLLEGVGDGEARVTELALKIIAPENEAEKDEALREAAFKPVLFAEIKEKWPVTYPSDENLRSYLIRRGFSATALDQVIAVFRDTVGLLKSTPPNDRPVVVAQEREQRPDSGHGKVHRQDTGRPGYDISFTGDAISISGAILSQEEASKVIAALSALSALLPASINGRADGPSVDDDEGVFG